MRTERAKNVTAGDHARYRRRHRGKERERFERAERERERGDGSVKRVRVGVWGGMFGKHTGIFFRRVKLWCALRRSRCCAVRSCFVPVLGPVRGPIVVIFFRR